MPWRALLLNRFSITFGCIAVLIVVWNVFVALNDGGQLTGRVVDGAGQGIANAVVTLSKKTITSVEPIGETRTGPNGYFNFSGHGQFSLILDAKAASGASERISVPLWFRNQNKTLSTPLVIVGAGAAPDGQARSAVGD